MSREQKNNNQGWCIVHQVLSIKKERAKEMKRKIKIIA